MSKGSDSGSAPSGSISTTNRSVAGSMQTSRFGRTTEIAESYFDTRLSMNPLSMAENTSTARALNASSFDHSTDVRPLCQYGSSEVISSCAWFTNEPKVLAAGMGMKYIRVYDTREDPNSPSSMVISTKAVHGLCMDPFHEDRMASCSDDGIIKIWDIRNPSQHILSFFTGAKTPQPSSALVRIQFNPQRSGLLGSLTKEASFLKVWDIQEGTVRAPRSVSRMDSNHALDSGIQLVSGGASGLLSRSQDREGLHTVRESESEKAEIGVPILWKSRRTKPSSKSLQSFAWIPTFVSNSTSGMISINKESLIETTILKETSQLAWEPKGALVVSDGNSISCFPSQRSLAATVPEPAPQHGLSEMRKRNSKVINLQLPANRKINMDGSGAPDNSSPPSISIVLPNGLTGPIAAEQTKSSGITSAIPDSVRRPSLTAIVSSGWVSATAAQVDQGLEQDISVTMREAAIKGYSMDATTNINLVEPGPLQDFWAWMVRAEKIAQRDGARINKFDFSYQGVLPVLTGNGVSRRSTPSGTPRAMSPLPRSSSSDLSTQLSKQADEIPIVPTLKHAQRKLGLKLCGSELLRSELKRTVERLEREGSFEVAAGWAFFHGELDLAIEVLSRGDDKLKLMSIVVAGFNRNHSSMSGTALGALSSNSEKASNSAWKAQCKSHGRSQSNPYIRAIFSYIATGDWRDVLEEKSLSLADRVGVALRFMSDDELMTYIQNTADSHANDGEIDGMILTGLTEAGLDLLTNYVNRTGDIQTATLASSVAVPRYFKDSRVDEWVEYYRDLLDRWQLYYTRARFDIARGRCIQQSTLNGVSAADMTPTQVYVRCNFCNQSIARNLLIPGVRGRDGRRLMVGPGSGVGHGGIMHGHDKQTSMGGGMGQGAGGGVPGAPGVGTATNSNKSIVCPSCSKPLPRCAICLLHLGVPAEGNAALGSPQASIYGSHGARHVAMAGMPCIWQTGSIAIRSAQSATASASAQHMMPYLDSNLYLQRSPVIMEPSAPLPSASLPSAPPPSASPPHSEVSRTVGSWRQKEFADPNATVVWASERGVYEWKVDYTDDDAPPNEDLEKELFDEDNQIHRGIHFEKYRDIEVGRKGGPDDFQPIEQASSGKTAAFLLPVLSRLIYKIGKGAVQHRPGDRRAKAMPLALIILPTRELGIQMFDEARRFTYRSRVRPAVIYGGAESKLQKEQLARGCDILVATPGRLVDAMERGWVSLAKVKSLILDEADMMLDMGFESLVRRIVLSSDLPRDESLQTLMFSATFPSKVQLLARDFLKDDNVRLRVGRIGGTTSDIQQKVIKVEEAKKDVMLVQLLLSQPPSRTMIFVDTKRRADNLDDILYNKDFPCISIHGDRSQAEREAALEAFKTGRSPILITTAIASRGWDIKNVLHVINYDLCSNIDEYVHRIGRTARAGHPGLATTFYNDRNDAIASQLVKLLVECKQEVPDFLQEFVSEATSYEDEGDDFVDEDDTQMAKPAASSANDDDVWGVEGTTSDFAWSNGAKPRDSSWNSDVKPSDSSWGGSNKPSDSAWVIDVKSSNATWTSDAKSIDSA
ncbi:hypothetical protein BG011_000429 [Mortierella polycephala]|uniref:RNA helicase n=1 Tax=Mortierella polycephala TaxID=41804 RepID=A0A9P6Q826_9FUNG|nr:hypothetical protein BG011_000429 [Mortierella polycephala]